MPKPKATYQVTTPDGNVKEIPMYSDETPLQHAQSIANGMIAYEGGVPAGCKVQRVKA